MASTNEDAVVLATAPFGEGGVLVVRHLPDRGTVEIGRWIRDEGGTVTQEAPVLELAAEAVEVDAVARLGQRLARTGWDAAEEGQILAETPAFVDDARIIALRGGAGIRLVRHPEGGELVLPSRAAFDRFTAAFAAALPRLADLGFGLMQQGDPASSVVAGDRAPDTTRG